MVHLVSIKTWKREHIVKHADKEVYYLYCDRAVSKDLCTEDSHENFGINTCAHCTTLYYNAARCDSREVVFGVGSIVQVPKDVSETGKIKIVADQTHCNPNTLQPGVSDWEYKAIEYDPDRPREFRTAFNITLSELEEWKELYK
jgi:hypothetical protein